MTDREPLLEVQNLEKYFDQSQGILDTLLGRTPETVKAVDDVTFTLHENESKGVIGESGCGKTTLLMVLLGLIDGTGGSVTFKGRDISTFDKRDWKQFRREVQVIFQNPFDSLDPKMSVRNTLEIPLDVHGIENKEERIKETLEQVELRPPERYIDRFPDQLSGGEKQRVAIARALVLRPDVILADEPVSMLDVSTQAVILKLLARLKEEMDLSIIYISHDLSTVSYICDDINVMYLGRIVETAPTMDILENPKHPYSKALINAIPIPDPNHDRERTTLEGSTPDPIGLGEGCRFRERCPERMDICDRTPAFIQEEGHHVACHLYYDHEEHEAAAKGVEAPSDD
ncbi:ABC transporter ATP-binding protein [Salinirubellus salinus]|uniref:ABC transporter ATP-binding protein n=1 Tax=Salinirubellus salinus TaxID=1364945 RepID=A0A9E7R2N6_9EURY|nr:ABC transporter ATP-binding protein [Salinirubellus salinus]UWM54442.1 ABC transporter ATP-binding protein [Salinirubellus salinus]